jgi:hypothetical protein
MKEKLISSDRYCGSMAPNPEVPSIGKRLAFAAVARAIAANVTAGRKNNDVASSCNYNPFPASFSTSLRFCSSLSRQKFIPV